MQGTLGEGKKMRTAKTVNERDNCDSKGITITQLSCSWLIADIVINRKQGLANIIFE